MQIGQPNEGDIAKHVVSERRGFVIFTTQEGNYPYTCDEGYIITSVLAEDHWDDDTGGTASIISGGVGQNHVTVHVKSQYGRGYQFSIWVTVGKKK